MCPLFPLPLPKNGPFSSASEWETFSVFYVTPFHKCRGPKAMNNRLRSECHSQQHPATEHTSFISFCNSTFSPSFFHSSSSSAESIVVFLSLAELDGFHFRFFLHLQRNSPMLIKGSENPLLPHSCAVFVKLLWHEIFKMPTASYNHLL